MEHARSLAMGEGARITAQAQGYSTCLTLQISASSLENGDNNDTWLAHSVLGRILSEMTYVQ